MTPDARFRRAHSGRHAPRVRSALAVAGILAAAACAPSTSGAGGAEPAPADAAASTSPAAPAVSTTPAAPESPAAAGESPAAEGGDAGAGTAAGRTPVATSSDPRVGLGAGLLDAEEAVWNLRVLSETVPPRAFVGAVNSDLAFTGPYAIQGSYNGFQVWDISDPSAPVLVKAFVCPASQSDVSVYRNLLFVSGEGLGGRLDCGTEGVEAVVSPDRLRGIRIFDISDIRNPEYIGNVQTCRGSHTHTVVEDPDDAENVYVYVSGSAGVRPEEELPGCSGASPEEDPNTALFRIEVIKVPLAHPERAAIVSSPRIFEDLVAPPHHGMAPEERAAVERAKERGAFVVERRGRSVVLSDRAVAEMLDSLVTARGGTGAPTAADSAMLRRELPQIEARRQRARGDDDGPRPGPTQCHDITVYPAIGLAGGACQGYGLLLDISDPAHPTRIAAVSDSNFSYWHSATFNNDGSKVLFSDEWGGGTQAKCRPTDPKEWGADAIFALDDGGLEFEGYYKLPAPQTPEENCVAHNGSLIPIPGRDVMVQAWYQGGISVFDWTDDEHPVEIAFFDRGPLDATQMSLGGSWSAYWYNGVIVSSEIVRGLDIVELTPSEFLSRNEIDAAKTVRLDYFNAQGQPRLAWPATFSLARAYVDQLERAGALSADRIEAIREALADAQEAHGRARSAALTPLADRLQGATGPSAAKIRALEETVRELATDSH